MDLNTVKAHLLYDFKTEHELIAAIKTLSQNFTSSREKIEDYLTSEKLISAYTAFYLLTNIPKLSAVFELTGFNLEDFKDFEIFDIGAGPGTFSLACLSINPDLEIKLIEKSALMRKQAQLLLDGIFAKSSFEIFDENSSFEKSSKKRLGIFGHSSNEMGSELTLKYIKKLELDTILFIEPGTKEFFNQALIMREELLKKYSIKFPCLSHNSCPLTEKDWCHQFVKVSHSVDLERISQILKMDRRNLPVIAHLYEKGGVVKDPVQSARVIRVYKPTKFSIDWQICLSENEENKIYDFQLLTRNYKKSEIKKMSEINAGELIHIRVTKTLEHNKLRGEIL